MQYLESVEKMGDVTRGADMMSCTEQKTRPRGWLPSLGFFFFFATWFVGSSSGPGNRGPVQWKCGALTTEPPGSSLAWDL